MVIQIQARIGKANVISLDRKWAFRMLAEELGPPAMFTKNWDF
jgi:hypothetical protein